MFKGKLAMGWRALEAGTGGSMPSKMLFVLTGADSHWHLWGSSVLLIPVPSAWGTSWYN
jgi:hypothetical protein